MKKVWIVLFLLTILIPQTAGAFPIKKIKTNQIQKIINKHKIKGKKPSVAPEKTVPLLLDHKDVAPMKALEKLILGERYLEYASEAPNHHSVRNLVSKADASNDYILKSRVLNRMEELARDKEALMQAFLKSVNYPSELKSRYSMHYIGHPKHTSVLNFDPAAIYPQIELFLNGKNPVMMVPRQKIFDDFVETGLIEKFFINEKEGAAVLQVKTGALTTDIKDVYKVILGCSPGNPCYFDFETKATIRIFSPDRKQWFRIGQHEIDSFYIHLHWNTTTKIWYRDAWNKNRTETVIAAFTMPLWHLENLQDPSGRDLLGKFASGASEADKRQVLKERLANRFQVFIYEPIDALQQEKLLVRLPKGKNPF